MIAKAVHKANARIRLPIMEELMRLWSLIVKLLHFANMPPKEDSVGQRNDHCTGSNKVD